MKKILNNKWFYFIVIFIFVLVFNFLTPYLLDDYQYMFDYTGTHRNNSIIDIFVNLKVMYFTWGGRMFAHFFAYLFLMFPKWIFNIVNSVVYVLNIYLIYLISKGDRKDNYSYLLLIHMIVFVFFPVFGQVFLWLDGSCNYSFTLLMQLFFIYKILNIKDGKYNYILYFIISLFAGMCNENSSLSLIVFLILYSFINRDNIKLKITSLIGLIIGYLFMFLAPGNYVRMEYEGGTSFFVNLIDKFVYLVSCFWPIIIAFFLLAIVTLFKNKEEGKLSLIIYISSLIAFFSMMASPQLNIRSFTMSAIYIFIIVMILFLNIKKDIIRKCLFIFFSILFLVVLFNTSKDYFEYSNFIQKRYYSISKAKNDGKKEVKIPIYSQSENCRVPVSCELEDIRFDKDDFPNYFMSKYYRIDIYGE